MAGGVWQEGRIFPGAPGILTTAERHPGGNRGRGDRRRRHHTNQHDSQPGQLPSPRAARLLHAVDDPEAFHARARSLGAREPRHGHTSDSPGRRTLRSSRGGADLQGSYLQRPLPSGGRDLFPLHRDRAFQKASWQDHLLHFRARLLPAMGPGTSGTRLRAASLNTGANPLRPLPTDGEPPPPLRRPRDVQRPGCGADHPERTERPEYSTLGRLAERALRGTPLQANSLALVDVSAGLFSCVSGPGSYEGGAPVLLYGVTDPTDGPAQGEES